MELARSPVLLGKPCVAVPALTPSLIITTVVDVGRSVPAVWPALAVNVYVRLEKQAAQVFVTTFKRIAITAVLAERSVPPASSVSVAYAKSPVLLVKPCVAVFVSILSLIVTTAVDVERSVPVVWLVSVVYANALLEKQAV